MAHVQVTQSPVFSYLSRSLQNYLQRSGPSPNEIAKKVRVIENEEWYMEWKRANQGVAPRFYTYLYYADSRPRPPAGEPPLGRPTFGEFVVDVFYVGKGTRDRALQHFSKASSYLASNLAPGQPQQAAQNIKPFHQTMLDNSRQNWDTQVIVMDYTYEQIAEDREGAMIFALGRNFTQNHHGNPRLFNHVSAKARTYHHLCARGPYMTTAEEQAAETDYCELGIHQLVTAHEKFCRPTMRVAVKF